MHPSQLPLDKLQAQCRWSFSRASGPGGQHRNKVETAASIEHLPSGIRASATEERSQQKNRQVALQRLRLALAVEYHEAHDREASDPNPEKNSAEVRPSETWRQYCRSGKLRVSTHNEHFPALLAEVFQTLVALDYHLPKTAEHLGTSATQLVRFLASHPPALERLNENLIARGYSHRTG
ncbi:MAG: peptide chain release factor family protein [Pirellula sp.]